MVNTQILRNIVDSLGGVEVNVPRRMEYQDKSQGLYLDLYLGVQILNGEQAEGLFRWRHNNDYSEQYAKGHEGRIETQQLFITALLDKLLSPKIINNLGSLIKTFYAGITTDLGLLEILDYIPYIDEIKNYTMQVYTLPREARKENGVILHTKLTLSISEIGSRNEKIDTYESWKCHIHFE